MFNLFGGKNTLAKCQIKFHEEGGYSIEWLKLPDNAQEAGEEKIWLACYQYAKMIYNVADSNLSVMALQTFIENILDNIRDKNGKFRRVNFVHKFLNVGKRKEPTNSQAYLYETILYLNNQKVKTVETKIPTIWKKEGIFHDPEQESRNLSVATVLVLIEDLLHSLPSQKTEKLFKILKRMHKFYKENDPDNPLLIATSVYEAFESV